MSRIRTISSNICFIPYTVSLYSKHFTVVQGHIRRSLLSRKRCVMIQSYYWT